MGTDFFEGLGETLTRKAKDLGERAESLYGLQKIRNKISAEERITDKIMSDIGKLIYKRFQSGEPVDSEIAELCEEIHQHLLKIREYKEDAASIKGEKICPSCKKIISREAVFCPFCGMSFVTDAEDIVAEEEQEDADCVISEDWEENFKEETEDVH